MNCNLPYTEETMSNYLMKYPESILKLEINLAEDFDVFLVKKLKLLKQHEKFQTTALRYQHQREADIYLDDCLRLFSTPEQLDESNASYCSKCKAHVQGIKKMDIYKAPKILIMHLKRFKQNGYYSSKNNKNIIFPIEGLDISKYALNSSGTYDLYAISNHFGSLGGGHYTAYCKNPIDEKWYNFDDSSVTSVKNPIETLTNPSAYVLFYRRRE